MFELPVFMELMEIIMPISLVFILFFGFFILSFLMFRKINCWYWKINKNIALLEEIRDLLKNK